MRERWKAFAPLVCLVLVASAPALAFAIQGPTLPANDLEAPLGLGQTAPQKTPETLPGPPGKKEMTRGTKKLSK